MPHGGMQGEAQNLEEERRLCYVGITRARSVLYLTRAATRVKRGKELPRTPSRFLEDIPAELVRAAWTWTRRARGPPPSEEKNFFANLKERFKAQGRRGSGLGQTTWERQQPGASHRIARGTPIRAP